MAPHQALSAPAEVPVGVIGEVDRGGRRGGAVGVGLDVRGLHPRVQLPCPRLSPPSPDGVSRLNGSAAVHRSWAVMLGETTSFFFNIYM